MLRTMSGVGGILATFSLAALSTFAAAPEGGLTDVAGLEVGHHTLTERPTGCTVILARQGAVASVDVRGGAPGTRETDLLDPVHHVQEVQAIVLSGGSAFGLDSASGVVRYLDEQGIGYQTRVARVPIVPAAILFDLGVGDKPHVRPGADCGYAAAKAASAGPVAEGTVGAGAGATVGKMGGPGRSMKAGIGTASIRLDNGLVVAALVAVNAVGDIIDPATGKVVAGARGEDGRSFIDARTLVRAGGRRAAAPRQGENTTIGVVATNARLTQVQAKKMAMMAHDGYARAISPSHLPSDGDLIFSLATGVFDGEVDAGIVGALAAEVMAEAIVRAATQATGLPGIPAVRDLGTVDP
ncbi:MAG TPA: P1 family peptidase [Thermoanaerobaculia bacterium]|nr:P1 family peptidase [Thermoanaerobaculia bacterium]